MKTRKWQIQYLMFPIAIVVGGADSCVPLLWQIVLHCLKEWLILPHREQETVVEDIGTRKAWSVKSRVLLEWKFARHWATRWFVRPHRWQRWVELMRCFKVVAIVVSWWVLVILKKKKIIYLIFFFWRWGSKKKKFPKVIHLREKTRTSSDTMKKMKKEIGIVFLSISYRGVKDTYLYKNGITKKGKIHKWKIF